MLGSFGPGRVWTPLQAMVNLRKENLTEMDEKVKKQRLQDLKSCSQNAPPPPVPQNAPPPTPSHGAPPVLTHAANTISQYVPTVYQYVPTSAHTINPTNPSTQASTSSDNPSSSHPV
ncbi:hypothetical protein CCACVL1_16988 [Corchorus capsularis]|uniref:Uncharacterized protein n=1 Tax=Corchorus capsularis TaxID=210143 RepID=A0A1R3HUY8_COCAP|nr:hypothetical protein CCACVL1_16988 [Corchorus capsularis]